MSILDNEGHSPLGLGNTIPHKCRCDFATGECQAPLGCKAVVEMQQLRVALTFYADSENYRPGGWQGDMDPSLVTLDGGKLARDALHGQSTRGYVDRDPA